MKYFHVFNIYMYVAEFLTNNGSLLILLLRVVVIPIYSDELKA